jgi:hypothetical protein
MVNYQPKFRMPVIAAQSYVPVLAATTVVGSSVGRYGLKVKISNPTYRQLLAMAGGLVSFVPAGSDRFSLYQTYPGLPQLSAGTGYVLQSVWIADVNKLRSVLPAGVPAMVQIVYFNVDPAAFRIDAGPRVASLKLSLLKSFGTIAGSPGRPAYETQLLDLLLQGKADLFFHGGDPIGKMASDSLILFFPGEDKIGISPIPYLRAMPDFAGSQWQGHPLIAATTGLPVPVDVYAQFNKWDSATGVAVPLPDGRPVRLVDYNPLIPNTTLATKPLAGGTGRVAFNLTETQIKPVLPGLPDLLFEVDLGGANPEPGLITDPWDSSVSKSNKALSPNSGYFEDFKGTRLGSATWPLQFQIGLGFWQYLINHRPSAAVQAAIKTQGFYGQPIENSYHRSWWDVAAQAQYDYYSSLSLDYYGVRITTLPNGFSTPRALMDHIRTYFNDFYDHSASFFYTNDPRWADPNVSPVGVMLEIDLKKFGASLDTGYVVVSDFDANGGWTVNTASNPGTVLPRLYHPLGGIRRWTFTTNSDGSSTFFTQGADRPYQWVDDTIDRVIFSGAHRLWKSWQRKLANFVNSKNGAAQMLSPFAERFDWPTVRDLYWADDPTNPWLVP